MRAERGAAPPPFPFDLCTLDSLPRPPARGRAGRALERRSRALSLALARAPRRAPRADRARWRAMRGWLAFRAGRLGDALRDLDAAVRLDGATPAYRLWRGQVHKSSGRARRAEADFSGVIASEPRAVLAYYGRAEARRNLGDRHGALEDARRVAELEPESGEAFRFLAKHRELVSGPEAGLRDIERSLELEPRSAEGRAWRGEILRRLGRTEEAARDFDAAVRLDPRHGLARVWRGVLRLRRGDPSGARRDLRRALQLDPGQARAHAWLGRVALEQGRTREAERAFTRAVTADPGFAWAFHQRALLRRAEGRLGEALRDLDAAVGIDRDLGYFEKHAEASPEFPERLAAAVGELEGYLSSSPRDPRAQRWRERLWDSLLALGRPRGRTFDLMLGYACNILCRFCSQELSWRRDGWMPPARARERIYLSRRQGAQVLNLLGGEVTVYPGIVPLVAFAKKLGFEEIQFESNGLRFADEGFAEAMAAAGLSRVNLSIHGASAESHDRQVKSPGAFDKLLRGLARLRGLGIPARATLVLNALNLAELEDFCRFFFQRHGIREFQFIYPLYTGDFLNHAEELAVPMAEAARALARAESALRRLGASAPMVHNMPPCVWPRLAQIGDWQDLGRRVVKPDGSEHEESLQAPLYRKAYAAACGGCRLRDRCVGVDPAYLRRWGEGEFRPYRP